MSQCACGCGRDVQEHDGRGRPGKYASAACRKRDERKRKSDVTKIDDVGMYDVTKVTNSILHGDSLAVLKRLPDRCIQCCVTSPPYYGLRDYGVDGQVGLEESPAVYIAKLVEVFREVRRVLRNDGTLWLNIGDSYASDTKGGKLSANKSGLRKDGRNEESRLRSAQLSVAHQVTPARKIIHGLKSKDLMMIPTRLAIALQEDGWYLRSDIIWHKPTAMPESVTDRPTVDYEHVFLLAKRECYYYDIDAIREPLVTKSNLREKAQENWGKQALLTPVGEGIREWNNPAGRNKRTVWSISSQPYPEAHFAVMPPKLVEPCILAGSSPQACEYCGAPWQRITEVTGGTWEERKTAGVPTRYGLSSSKGTSVNKMGQSQSYTTGWQPTCKCENTGSGKSIILDPFMGSGTVGLVALQHNRNYIGVELNASYIELAKKRLAVVQPTLFEAGA